MRKYICICIDINTYIFNNNEFERGGVYGRVLRKDSQGGNDVIIS